MVKLGFITTDGPTAFSDEALPQYYSDLAARKRFISHSSYDVLTSLKTELAIYSGRQSRARAIHSVAGGRKPRRTSEDTTDIIEVGLE